MEYFDDTQWIDDKFGPYICYSGGADGADTIFEEECTKKNIKVVAFSFPNHNTKSPNKEILTKNELEEGYEHVKKANETLKRNIYGLKPYILNLLSRDWFQVKNSDVIYAIGTIQNNMKIVNGGTGWCCMMSIDNHKIVYVFNQNENSWFEYNYEKEIFEKYKGIPKLTKKFAGVGTREINENGIKAIKDLLRNI